MLRFRKLSERQLTIPPTVSHYIMTMDTFDKVWNKFESLIEEKKSCSICMKKLIEILKSEMSKKTYEKLTSIDFQTEVNLVKEHIISELKNKPLAKSIKGIWFWNCKILR